MNSEQLATDVFTSVKAWLARQTAAIEDRAQKLEDRAQTTEYRLGILQRDIKKVADDLEFHLQRIREDIEDLKTDERDRIELP